MRLRGKWISTIGFSLLAATAVAQENTREAETSPNDPYLTYQSALFSPEAETNNSLARAWEISTDASSIVVAVIDTGIEIDHPDLSDNIWFNSYEIPENGVDDDENGYVDDVNGFDFKNNDGEGEDLWGHGTLTAGIIGAVGDNGIGTAGVAWSVQMMDLKVFGASGGGKVKDFVSAIRYAIRNGAQIIHAGWTIPSPYPGDQIPALEEAIEEAQEAGVLVVAAAGNDAVNLDETPIFPASYPHDHIVSVAALSEDESSLLENSNYGAQSVSLATVGDQVLGPYLSKGYGTLTGTSSAAALVTGMAALILAQRPDLTPQQIKEVMLSTTTPVDSLKDRVNSAGALNFYDSLNQALIVENEPKEPSTTDSNDTTEATTQGYLPVAASGGCSLIP